MLQRQCRINYIVTTQARKTHEVARCSSGRGQHDRNMLFGREWPWIELELEAAKADFLFRQRSCQEPAEVEARDHDEVDGVGDRGRSEEGELEKQVGVPCQLLRA